MDGAVGKALVVFFLLFLWVVCMGLEDPSSGCVGAHIACSEPVNQCPADSSTLRNMFEDEPLQEVKDEVITAYGLDETVEGSESSDDDDDFNELLQMFTEPVNEFYDELVSMVVNVDDFGGIGDGDTDDTEAFENSWKEACSSAPSILRVPEGKTYLVKSLTFSGPCQAALRFQVGGKIVAPKDPNEWNESNPRLWLHFYGVDDLTVEGGGTLDGRGEQWWAKSCKTNKSNPCSTAPTAVTFDEINNLVVRNLKVKNAQQIQVSFQNCVAVQAKNLNISAPGHSPNTDGIHVTASKNVVIKNSFIGTGDDCISIVSGSVNIRAQNITCGPGHGISIGSLGKGNSEAKVSNIMVDGAHLHDTTNGVRIKTWQGGLGYARSITFKNINMKNVSNPIIIDQNYCDSDKPCPKQNSAVKISHVYYKNIKGTTPSKEAVVLDCSEAVPCKGIVLQNIQLLMNSGDIPSSHCANVKGSVKGTIIPSACF